MQIHGYFDLDGAFHLTKPLKTRFGEVCAKFKTDGFSIPWFLHWFHNPFGWGLLAAIWHDFALKKGDKLAHWQFRELLIDLAYQESSKLKRHLLVVKTWLMYFAVVGYAHYKAFRRKF